MDGDIKAEVIVIDDDDDEQPIPIKSNLKSNRNDKHKQRKVTLDTSNGETLLITQKVEVKKKTINIYEEKEINYHKNKLHARKERLKEFYRLFHNRTVPKCSRYKCQHTNNKIVETKEIQGKRGCLHKSFKKNHERKYNKEAHAKSEHSNHHKKKLKTHDEIKKKNILISPLSISSFTISSENIFEDISSGSFLSHSDSDLDVLIRKAKKREKINPEQKLSTAVNVNKGIQTENLTDDDVNMSLRSLHSTSTLILSSQCSNDIYSPINDIHDIKSQPPELNCEENEIAFVYKNLLLPNTVALEDIDSYNSVSPECVTTELKKNNEEYNTIIKHNTVLNITKAEIKKNIEMIKSDAVENNHSEKLNKRKILNAYSPILSPDIPEFPELTENEQTDKEIMTEII